MQDIWEESETQVQELDNENEVVDEENILWDEDNSLLCMHTLCIPDDYLEVEYEIIKDGIWGFWTVERYDDSIKNTWIFYISPELKKLYEMREEGANIDFEKEVYTYLADEDILIRHFTEIFHSEYDFVKQHDSFFHVIHHSSGCWGESFKQALIDRDTGDKLDDLLTDIMPQSFTLGDVVYTKNINFQYSSSALDRLSKDVSWSYDSTFRLEEKMKPIIETEKIFLDTFTLTIPGYDVVFQYSSRPNIVSSHRVIYLGTNQDWLSENIASNWDFMNLELTNRIIWYFWEYDALVSNMFIQDKNFERIERVTQAELPVFQVKRINDVGNYVIYLTDDYEFWSFAEMCKPVVYYYSPTTEQNTLTFQLHRNDFYTTLIPDFNRGNGWDFTWKNGKVIVDDTTYDYLYYSIMSSHYEHNENGWIVGWEDMEVFFDEKLDAIWFLSHEKNDFLEYWRDEYESWRYYFVSFKYNEELDFLAPMSLAKEPENIIRVLLDSYELETLESYQKRFLYIPWEVDRLHLHLIQSFTRYSDRREVFEWWGVLRKSDTIIIR